MTGLADQPSLRRAAYLATAMGILHAVLYLLSFWILRDSPGLGASDAALIQYYGGTNRTKVLITGIYLLPIAAIAFIWFITALRMWIAQHGRPEHFLYSNLQLISGILYTALLLVAAAAFSVDSAVAALAGGQVDPESARNFPQFGKMVAVMLDMRMAGIFVITTATISRHSWLLPIWFTWLSYAVGLLLLFVATLNTVFAVVFPVWILLLAVLLMLRVRRAGKGEG